MACLLFKMNNSRNTYLFLLLFMTLSSINSCKKYEDEAEADPCLSVVQEGFQRVN
jgi:hypothetical protein